MKNKGKKRAAALILAAIAITGLYGSPNVVLREFSVKS